MNAHSIEVDVSFITSNAELLAVITYTNKSSEVAFLEKVNGCLNGAVENNVFTITMDGEPIKYIGRYVKRRPAGPDDYATLPGRKELTVRVRIDEVYGFPSGLHAYTGFYSALHTYKNHSGFFELKSKSVNFSFDCKK